MGFAGKSVIFLFLLLQSMVAAAGQGFDPGQEARFYLGRIEQLASHLKGEASEGWARDLDWARLQRFYSQRDFRPVWFGEGLWPTAMAEFWRDTLIFAELEGLEPKEYHIEAIRYLWRARRVLSQVRLELLLTDAFFRYSIEVHAGYQAPRVLDVDWYLRGPRLDPLKTLDTITRDEATFKEKVVALPPPHAGYLALKKALLRYLDMQDAGEWQKIPAGPSLRLGDRDPRVALIRERLAREGYLEIQSLDDNILFDERLEEAIRRFQNNYGHKVDGIVGRFTLYSLNISLAERIEQIKQNMERWRWMPRNLGQRYVMVNMAGYKLYVMEDNQVVLDMRVVIGKPFRSTPAFQDQLEYLVLNPVWKVPPRLAEEEILPKLQKNPEFLAKNNIRVYSSWSKSAEELNPEEIDWNELDQDSFQFRLEQSPGDQNSMGRVKFMFPNPFRVYLHDTPARHLFRKQVRTFSSGCIRVERPVTLVSELLRSEEWTPDRVRDVIASGETMRVDLPKKLPIYLLYWTAWVEDDGFVYFRRDVYSRNENIATDFTSPQPQS